MTHETVTTLALAAALCMAVAGCKTVATDQDEAARIVEPDDASRTALRRVVNTALHTEVTLADDALTDSSLLVIERSPARRIQGHPTQGRIMEAPIQFRLVIHGEDCVLIDERDRSRYQLENTRCKAE